MSDVTEIERKFLIQTRPSLDGLTRQAIRQGYLTEAADAVEVRVRQVADAYFLTVKSGGGIARTEREIAISVDQFDALWPGTEGKRVEKTRYTGAFKSGLIFEIDIYAGGLAPLEVVEVEFASLEAAEQFTPPEWFGRDVSDDKSFKNKRLAVAGAPPIVSG